ncbi:MAG: Lrp/AsnC family transcriptional regulator [Thaumarchaeota archaeon]|nr:Lrp/AsnC family transcriptional regulator [Nitrososphaerota archaeon]
MKKRDGSQVNLDRKDELLISILQNDAELSLSAIGEQVGLSKMAVSNRIKSLRDAGILEGSHYRVNPQKVGQDYLMVSQVICDASGPEQEEVGSQIARLPGVQTVYLNFGSYDILFVARRRDKQSAKELLYKVSRIHGIRNTLTTIPHTVIKESLEVRLEP